MIAASKKGVEELLMSPEMLQKARVDALNSRRNLFDVLIETTSANADSVLIAIGKLMHFPVLFMEDLNQLSADFEVIDYSDAVKHDCIAFRDDQSSLMLVFGDPFNHHLQDWAQSHIRGNF